MFCPNCGNNLPDGSAFCGNCGTKLQQQPAQQPQYQAPPQPQYQQPQYQQPQYQPPYAPAKPAPIPISKKDFLALKADASTKQSAKLVTITFILSLILILASIIAPLANSMFDIPVVSAMLTIAEADSDELIDELEMEVDQLEADYKLRKDTMDRDERDAVKEVLDCMEALTDNFSVLNLTALISTTERVGEDYMDSDTLSDMEDAKLIMYSVIGVLAGFFLLPLLFALLGGLKKSTGLTVAALIFTVLSQLSLSGIVFVILSLVIFIFQIMLCNKLQTAYQNYRLGRTA